MFPTMGRGKRAGAKRPVHMFAVILAAGAVLLLIVPKIWAIPFSTAKIIIEVNATGGDAGLQISVDAAGWKRLQVFAPNGKRAILDVLGSGSLGRQGITEFFIESAEPSFDTFPLNAFFARFPAGDYDFRGTTVDGQSLTGKATLTHAIPAGPVIVSPQEGQVVKLDPGMPVAIEWKAVTTPFQGTASGIKVVSYQVVVMRESPTLRVYSVDLPAAATQVTVPAAFLEPGTVYKAEVLAIEAGGNQTISERAFQTK